MTDMGATLPAIVIPSGAHHLDLRGTHQDDPEDVVKAREREKELLYSWLAGGTATTQPSNIFI